jgi:hypothetical protein
VTFAATFRDIVIPDITRLCRAQGLFVALALREFSDAWSTVMAHATRRGASALPADILQQLDDFIGTSILRAVDEFMPSILERRAIADRVAIDIARCEAAWPTT